MNPSTMSLKEKIKNYAKKNNITAQVVLQNYMFERFLERLSKSEYSEKFVIKGGLLIASVVGLATRTTMDLDATLKNLPLTEDKILSAIKNICNIKLNDDVSFTVKNISPIRKNDTYGGFCVKLNSIFDTIITPLSIDISTGDVITPKAVKYKLYGLFDTDKIIKLWGYNIETILAEKIETILSWGIFNTRPRDYYDVYILATTQNYSKEIFNKALKATSIHRGSFEKISDVKNILNQISKNKELQQSWLKYQLTFDYAKNISFMQIISVIEKICIEYIDKINL